MITGFLKVKECMAFRSKGRIERSGQIRFRNMIREYNPGEIITIYGDPTNRSEWGLLVSEGAVLVLDKDMKPTTWESLLKSFEEKERERRSTAKEPVQKDVIVQEVKAVTRPVRRVRKKKDG